MTKFSVHVSCGRGSVLLWQRCCILSTSGLGDDAMFAPKTLYACICHAYATSITSVRPSVTLVDCDHIVQKSGTEHMTE